MKQSFLLMAMLFLCVSLVTFTSCDNDDDESPAPTPNILEFASDNADFTTLAAAVEQAGLDGILNGDGPFTVFAPNNAAFNEFLTANNFNSLEDVPQDLLASVLAYHVVVGEFASTDLSTSYVSSFSATSFGTTNDPIYADLYLDTSNGVVINGDVTVTSADNTVSNGIIHAVNKVIGLPTIVTFATTNPDLSTLVQALTRSDLSIDFVDVLTNQSGLTVFAPTNQAFQNLLDSNAAWNSLDDIPVSVLEEVLLYHVTDAGNVRSTDLTDGMMVTTLAEGETFTIDLSGNVPAINAAGNTSNIVFTDVQATNGVVHVIDTVILPNL